MNTSGKFFFLVEAQRKLAQEMSGNSLANAVLLTSENLTTPLGVVFDLWHNDDEARAQALLKALLAKRESGLLSVAFLQLEATLFGVHHVGGEVINSFALWLNKNGLNVQLMVAVSH